MKIISLDKTNVGVIVGRFQVPSLHEGHQWLIQNAIDRHEKVIIFIGTARACLQKRNPLDFLTRKKMLETAFGNRIVIAEIKDIASNEAWSKELDAQIQAIFPNENAILYGSRHSFLPNYSGIFLTQAINPIENCDGTSLREKAQNTVLDSPDFRAGILYAAAHRHAVVYATVDVVIFNMEKTKILLGRKPLETAFRFIGGFADTSDNSFEETAIREAKEECGDIELIDLQYITSKRINDWRYQNTEDCIITHLFTARLFHGTPQPNDDIAELRWFDIQKITTDILVKEHGILLEKIVESR